MGKGKQRIDKLQEAHEAQMRHAERRNRQDLARAIGFDRSNQDTSADVTERIA